MDQKEKNIQITEAIENAGSIIIMPGKEAGIDAFCAGVGLYHMLKAKNKKVAVVYDRNAPEGCEGLIEPAELKAGSEERELVVSIDYTNSPAAKAQYTTNDGVLYIKVSPIHRDFDLARVKTELRGEKFDLVFTVGAKILEDYGQTYRDLEEELGHAKIVNIDNTDKNMRYGNFNIVDTGEPRLSLLLLNISRFWRLKVSQKAARALLTGISAEKA